MKPPQSKKNYYNYTVPAALLLPVTFNISLAHIRNLPEAPQGDTTFAWLPVLLFVPGFIVFVILVAAGSISNPNRVQMLCKIIPALCYILTLIVFSFPGNPDGIPLSPKSLFIWFTGMLFAMLPGILLGRKVKDKNA